MKTFVFFLKNKRRGTATIEMLVGHVEHLKKLNAEGSLVICGPFADNDGAIQIIRADEKSEAIAVFLRDPFIAEKYYKAYDVYELFEANNSNDWLMNSNQTNSNLKPTENT